MINGYQDFEDRILNRIKFRAKNFVITTCEFKELILSVYDDITTDVILESVTQAIQLEKDVYVYSLPNSYIEQGDSKIDYYSSFFDIVNEEYHDVSNFVTEITNGTYKIDESYVDSMIDENILLLRKKKSSIEHLNPMILQNIITGITEGIMYEIYESIPSEINSKKANLAYQRLYNAKKILKEIYPQTIRFDGRQVGSQTKTGAL